VRFELEERGEETILHLTHSGFATDEQRSNHDHGWAHYAVRLRTSPRAAIRAPTR
jgi:hypothetical protein